MPRTTAPARVDLKSGRWLLPWIGILLASATVAYVVNSAVVGGFSASARQPDLQFAGPTRPGQRSGSARAIACVAVRRVGR
jgi:hypothetical protein